MDSDATPPLDPAILDRVRFTLDTNGSLAAIDQLTEDLRAAGDYKNLFYALLMRKRVELGVNPFPTGPAGELPPHTHEAYEDAIRSAGRHVGQLYLDQGDIPKAWVYFRMLGELEPIRKALAAYQPGPEDDTYPVVEIAWQHLVLPEKGFDLILDRHGICSSITMVHSADFSQNPKLRDYCVQRLIRSLHDQLRDRLRTDLTQRGLPAPDSASIPELIQGRDELFAEGLYHIDTSHLSSVVQMAMQLPKCPELDLARELCAYGVCLSREIRGDNDPPFENTYLDYGRYLDAIAGVDVDAALAHFRDKLPGAATQGYTFPAEVAVNLHVKADRPREALAIAQQYLATEDERSLNCPNIHELAWRIGDFATLTEVARSRSDAVTYLAGLIASQTPSGGTSDGTGTVS